MGATDRVTLVEASLKRELKHLGWRLWWGQPDVARSVYANIMDSRLSTSPEIKRLQAEATEKMKQAGLSP